MRVAELFDLRGRTALVTGAGRGIGRHLALGLAEAGADLLLTGRRQGPLVQPAGREKVRRTKHKNVHAYVSGEVVAKVPEAKLVPVTYNPYKHDTFVRCDDGTPVTEAEYVLFETNGRAYAIFEEDCYE